jgi:hypothetical protein
MNSCLNKFIITTGVTEGFGRYGFFKSLNI